MAQYQQSQDPSRGAHCAWCSLCFVQSLWSLPGSEPPSLLCVIKEQVQNTSGQGKAWPRAWHGHWLAQRPFPPLRGSFWGSGPDRQAEIQEARRLDIQDSLDRRACQGSLLLGAAMWEGVAASSSFSERPGSEVLRTSLDTVAPRNVSSKLSSM